MPFSTARTRNGPNAVAPLWHTRPIGPVRPSAPREDAVAQMSSLTFASPRQLGPLIRLRRRRQKPPAILHPRRRADDRNGARVEHFVDRRHLWFCPELHDTP